MTSVPHVPRRIAALALAGAVGVLTAYAPAEAKHRSKPTKVPFVLMSARFAGQRIVANGGPTVPAGLNAGLVNGKLVPQANGNEFTFTGTVRRGGAVHAAATTTAAALPLAAVPVVVHHVVKSMGQEATAQHTLRELSGRTNAIDKAITALEQVKADLAALKDGGRLDSAEYEKLNAKVDSALGHDHDAAASAAEAEGKGPKRRRKLRDAAIAQLGEGIKDKSTLVSELGGLVYREAVFPGEPPPTPVSQAPVAAPGPLTAIDDRTDTAVGSSDPGTPGEKGFVLDLGAVPPAVTYQGPAGLSFFAIGPQGLAGGRFAGDPVFRLGQTLVHLDVGGGNGGVIRGGDRGAFVGTVFGGGGSGEQATAWVKEPGSPHSLRKASAPKFKRVKVGKFSGGSSLFTVSGKLAFGDRFDHGQSGTFRPFRAAVKSGKVTELYRPKGGSGQPLASNRTGLAGGGSVFSSGRVESTLWWGKTHYRRFGSAKDHFITGMNEAGVAVGAIGPSSNRHAALFEHGKAYDLNKLIPSGSGWVLTKANDIDNAGVVVGAGTLNGQERGFVLDLSSVRG